MILIVPMCILAAMAGVNLRGLDNNILTQIGLIVLIGLAAKNAILIVEFARQGEEEQGPDPCEAGRRRPLAAAADPDDRFAFIFGVLPLVIARAGRRNAPGAGHGGVLRHDRGDRVRPDLHPGLLRRLPQAGGLAAEAAAARHALSDRVRRRPRPSRRRERKIRRRAVAAFAALALA